MAFDCAAAGSTLANAEIVYANSRAVTANLLPVDCLLSIGVIRDGMSGPIWKMPCETEARSEAETDSMCESCLQHRLNYAATEGGPERILAEMWQVGGGIGNEGRRAVGKAPHEGY